MSSETSDSESSDDDDDASNSSNSDDDAGEDAVKLEESNKFGREQTGGAGTMVGGLFYCCRNPVIYVSFESLPRTI